MSDPAASPTPHTEPPKSFAALRHPQYRIYFITTALAMMADNIEHVISYWMLYEKFHSPTLAGVAILTHWLPFLLFSVYSGAAQARDLDHRPMLAAELKRIDLVVFDPPRAGDDGGQHRARHQLLDAL